MNLVAGIALALILFGALALILEGIGQLFAQPDTLGNLGCAWILVIILAILVANLS